VSWDDVARSFLNRISGKSKTTSELRALWEESVDREAPLRQQLHDFYYAVNRKIPAGGRGLDLTRPASIVLSSAIGSRLLVFKSLLDEMNIPNRVVLVNSKLAPKLKVRRQAPSPAVFDRAILRVRTDGGGAIWLDPSTAYGIFDYLTPDLRGALALELRDEGARFIRLPDVHDPEAVKQETVEYRLKSDGTIQGTASYCFAGYLGIGYRAVFAETEPSERNTIFNRIFSPGLRQLDLLTSDVINLDQPEEPLIVSFIFRDSEYAHLEGNEIVLRHSVLPLALSRQFVSSPTRKTPLKVSLPVDVVSESTYILPGELVAPTPESRRISAPFGRYSIDITHEGNVLTIRRQMNIGMRTIPAQLYQELADFCIKVDRDDDIEIRVTRPSEATQ